MKILNLTVVVVSLFVFLSVGLSETLDEIKQLKKDAQALKGKRILIGEGFYQYQYDGDTIARYTSVIPGKITNVKVKVSKIVTKEPWTEYATTGAYVTPNGNVGKYTNAVKWGVHKSVIYVPYEVDWEVKSVDGRKFTHGNYIRNDTGCIWSSHICVGSIVSLHDIKVYPSQKVFSLNQVEVLGFDERWILVRAHEDSSKSEDIVFRAGEVFKFFPVEGMKKFVNDENAISPTPSL